MNIIDIDETLQNASFITEHAERLFYWHNFEKEFKKISQIEQETLKKNAEIKAKELMQKADLLLAEIKNEK